MKPVYLIDIYFYCSIELFRMIADRQARIAKQIRLLMDKACKPDPEAAKNRPSNAPEVFYMGSKYSHIFLLWNM